MSKEVERNLLSKKAASVKKTSVFETALEPVEHVPSIETEEEKKKVIETTKEEPNEP